MAKIQLSGEQAEKALRILEVVKQSGKIKKGLNEVTKAIERSQAKLVVIASDANPAELIMHIPILCDEKEVKCVVAGNREELGAASGLTLGTVAVVITEEGSAKDDLAKFVESL
jgi:large subunit ribosomal protein L7Ae